MEPLSVVQCKKLIVAGKELSDSDVLNIRETLYTLADVITDAFASLAEIDQAKFRPYGDVIDQLNELGGPRGAN
jgi:hypothetical protein